MKDHDGIIIGLCVIKHCDMHSREYKNRIVCENKSPPILELTESFKEYLAVAITLVNQTAIPAANHGYSMADVDDGTLFTLYRKSLANFGAAYAATQESIKNQATSTATMQGQLASIQQFCLAVGQQIPSNGYTPVNQHRASMGRHNQCNRGGDVSGSNDHGGFWQQPTVATVQ